MYSQLSIPNNIMLGKSQYPANKFGCLVTDIGKALLDAGYDVSPTQCVEALNAVGAINDEGLLIWGDVQKAYPQFHLDPEGDYTFQEGRWGGHEHFLLHDKFGIFDPWYGLEQAPAGFVAGSFSQRAHIDPPAQPAPSEPVPTPPATPEPAPTSPTVAKYTVQEGDNLTSICAKHYGIADPGDAYRKALEVATYNHLDNPNNIHTGQIINLP